MSSRTRLQRRGVTGPCAVRQVDRIAGMLRAVPPCIDAAVERLLQRIQAPHAPLGRVYIHGLPV